MQTILIVIHLMVVLALVGVVLLQRSEGGGLGIGGGSGFMTARGAANALTRTTGILAMAFFATSLALSILARYGERPTDILDRRRRRPPASSSPGQRLRAPARACSISLAVPRRRPPRRRRAPPMPLRRGSRPSRQVRRCRAGSDGLKPRWRMFSDPA